MKQFFKKKAMLIMALTTSVNISALNFNVDGIYYRTLSNDEDVCVISNSYKYKGDVVIPFIYDCSSLTSITIPNSVTSIGANAFEGCGKLTSVYISDIAAWCKIMFINDIGAGVFYSSNPLYYAEHLFLNGEEVIKMEIPNGVTNIGDYAFVNCKMTSVTFSETVTSIGKDAFSECSSLTSVTIPNSVTSIGEKAFSSCGSLTSLTIPNSVTSIGDGTFYGCSSLASITISKSVTIIGEKAFYGCSSLTSVHVSDIAAWCKISFLGVDNNHYESNPLYYAKHLFLNGEEVINLEIPNGVTNISGYAFGNCSNLISVTIPESVTNIGKRAFQGCYRLHTIYCLNTIPPSCDEGTFYCPNSVRDGYDVYTYTNLHVPMGSGEVYSSAYDWRYFNKIKEDMESGGKVHYANLIVQQGTTGYTRQAVKAAEKYTIYIGSLGENRVNAVVFNGTDVTEEVVNGYYTTPEIKGESVLSISYETETSANSAILNNVRVTGYDGEIHINYIDEMSDVFVYSVDGELVGNISSVFGSVSIHVPAEQLYMVKVGERTYKVAL